MSLDEDIWMSCGDRKRQLHAFTLVELLVVIAVIGVLTTMLMPAVQLARESSRKATCQSNLRQFGIGLNVNADQQKGLYCSGAFDWLRDGAVTETGWVADLVNQGIPVGKMVCPSNAGQVCDAFNDLLSAPPKTDSCVNRVGSRPKVLPDGTRETNPCRLIIENSLDPGNPERVRLIDQEIMQRHYNTNYTASWLLVRSRPLLDAQGNVQSRRPGCSSSLLTRTATAGPMSQQALDSSDVPSSTVPFLGCGATVGSLSHELADHQLGTFTTRSFTVGPILATTGQKPAFSPGTPRNGANGWWSVWNKKTLQDYRGFAPVHQDVCNMLMADGSVRTFNDDNRDGALDNGLTAIAQGDDPDRADLELPEQEVFSGAALRGL